MLCQKQTWFPGPVPHSWDDQQIISSFVDSTRRPTQALVITLWKRSTDWDGQGLSLKTLLQATVMDLRHSGFIPGSIRCSGSQIGVEINRHTQTPVNRHLGGTTCCFLQKHLGWGEVRAHLPHSLRAGKHRHWSGNHKHTGSGRYGIAQFNSTNTGMQDKCFSAFRTVSSLTFRHHDSEQQYSKPPFCILTKY